MIRACTSGEKKKRKIYTGRKIIIVKTNRFVIKTAFIFFTNGQCKESIAQKPAQIRTVIQFLKDRTIERRRVGEGNIVDISRINAKKIRVTHTGYASIK